MKKDFLCLRGFLTVSLLIIPAYSVLASDSNEILLKSRHFTPQRGITSSVKASIESVPGRVHVFLQLERQPTPEDVNHLESKGVKLFSYIPNKAWLASIPSYNTSEIAAISNVRSISVILPEDKISPHLKSGDIFEPSIKDGNTLFIIEFFEDVSTIEIEETIARHNSLITGWVPILNAIEAVLPVEEGIALASEEGVKWLEQELPLGPTNNGIRSDIGVNTAQAPPYNLNGAGVNILVYDVGLVDSTHSDLVNRVIIGETGYIDTHSTHVAGTVAGDGTLSSGKYRGMAPAANIISYHVDCGDYGICDYNDATSIADMHDNFGEGISTHHADIITASIGFQPAPLAKYDGSWCSYEGDYSAYAQEIDSFAMDIPITWAAANERHPFWGRPCGEYSTISPTATAKNAIVVGAVNSNDNSMTSFSSWGPTDDGRIKPDIVAPGCENDFCRDWNDLNWQYDPNKSIWSTYPSQSYGGYCGTSMATPAVAGSIALLLQQWRMTHPGQSDPPPAAIKAILINTAVDLGNTGPDYSFGYGLLDVRAAIDLIRDTNNYKISYDINGSNTYFTIEVPQNTPEFKITLAWEDTPGEPLADPALVYDADLIVREPNGTRHYPWILNPSNPCAPATRGEDHTNNVEQVSVSYPTAGTWTIDVNINIPHDLRYAIVWGFPKFFDISKEDDIPDGNNVSQGDSITYSIHYRYPLDHNSGGISNVVITDFLPPDLAFVSASGPNNVYHPSSNTVTWSIGTLEPNDLGSVTLSAKVSDCITACGAVTNSCEINGGSWNSWASEYTPVLCASNPSPSCGQVSDSQCNGDPNLNLTWCPGRFAATTKGHEVYFGTNYHDVRDAVNSWPLGEVYKGEVNNPFFSIPFSDLQLGTTYYWRIDEINDSNVWKGGIWSFTVGCYLLDNFDEYPPLGNDGLKYVWNDFGNNGNDTSAEVWVEQSTVRSVASMKYQFEDYNYPPYYSEARAEVNTAPSPYDGLGKTRDWLGLDAKVLSLWFYGQPGNDANKPMYIKLVDGDVTPHTSQVNYDGNMLNIRDAAWHEWNILLSDFTDVNLSNVKTIIIGFGDGTRASTDGVVYFEDIRLYLKRCFPGYYPPGDFVPDCSVDFYDFAVLASAWLTNNHDISLDSNDNVNIHDLAIFCDYWLWQLPYEQSDYPLMKMTGYGFSQGNGSGESLYTEEPTSGELAESTEQSQPVLSSVSEEGFESVPEPQTENETPGIWLVYDGNTLPAQGDEITVYIHSDPLLLTMATEIEVTGDANIISAMGEADCNSFGWDGGLSFDPYNDANSWFIDNFFLDWGCTATGSVSYLKFRYNSGVVTISFTEYNLAYDAYGQSILFSDQPLVFGDPNQN